MWAASPSSLSKAEGGCGGVGIWYKHRRSLPGTGPLGRGGRPEDGVNVSSLEVRLFQVLTSSLSALPWGPSSLGHQGAPRGAEPFWVPQLATGLLCWSTRTRAPSRASSHLPLAEGLPSDTPHLLLSSRAVASQQRSGSGGPACWQLGCGWGRKDGLGVSSLPVAEAPQHGGCLRTSISSIRGHRALGPHC